MNNRPQVLSKKTMDTKMIEEWLNEALNEAELMKDIPVKIVTQEARVAMNRFGIDRITLTNAGIADEEVTRLYKTLYVHSEGYLTTIKEICSNIKDIKLG
jgi:hypothetical protein